MLAGGGTGGAVHSEGARAAPRRMRSWPGCIGSNRSRACSSWCSPSTWTTERSGLEGPVLRRAIQRPARPLRQPDLHAAGIVDGRIDVLGPTKPDRPGRQGGCARPAWVHPAGAVRGWCPISVSGLSEHRHNDVVLAVVEDGLVSKVERGENAGRTLTHAAVVRSLRQVGSVRPAHRSGDRSACFAGAFLEAAAPDRLRPGRRLAAGAGLGRATGTARRRSRRARTARRRR